MSIKKDCEKLLDSILDHNPNKPVLDVYIAQMSEEAVFNRFLNSRIYGYRNENTPAELKVAGVFNEIEKIDKPSRLNARREDSPERIIEDFLDSKPRYRKKLFDDELKGLFRIRLTYNSAKNWLSSNDKVVKNPEILEQKEDAKVLDWRSFHLDIETCVALIHNKSHRFQPNKPPFRIFKALLEKRVLGESNGEVTYDEFAKVTGINDKDTIKSKIRELRRQFGINRNKNPLEDVFQPTNNGYRLVSSEPFNQKTTPSHSPS